MPDCNSIITLDYFLEQLDFARQITLEVTQLGDLWKVSLPEDLVVFAWELWTIFKPRYSFSIE